MDVAPKKISLEDKFASFADEWAPRTLASIGTHAIKAVKVSGEFVWHDHVNDDEVFFVVSGGITMEYRLGDGTLGSERFETGEMLRIPAGMQHRPVADPGTQILLFEREAIVNTGSAQPSERTRVSIPIER